MVENIEPTEVIRLDVTLFQGSSWDGDFFIVLDPNQNVVDFTGKEFISQVKGCYSSPNKMLEMSTSNGRIILTNGEWQGEWDDTESYVVDDIVSHEIIKDDITYNIFFICKLSNAGEEPDLEDDTYWEVYRQIRFNLSAEETAELIPGNYFYDLEIEDFSATPGVVNKLTYGRFIVNPEVTKQ